MSQQWFDPGSKWLLEERAASLLWLAGARKVLSARALKAEVVQPRQLPDGLLEARFAREKDPRTVLVEVATYPEPRVVTQMQDGLRLVRQARGVLPDAVVLCLAPKGTYRVPDRAEEVSPLGWSGEALRWKVVELWTIPAEELLAAPDVGVVPWATLGQYDGAPEVLLRRCRDRVDREGGEQRANLLAVTQVFARMHFDRPDWLEILGGRKAMTEAPWFKEMMLEVELRRAVKSIDTILAGRFGPPDANIQAGLSQVKSDEALDRLTLIAATCPSLQAFERSLRSELPQPTPPSTRGRRRKST
jgi:hypothetical protein